ncbi:hypothetical protein [Halomonas ramblicola]|uniref:hypothetical protein n=1 Tax=Halomonas ramblicola TaxID=747349 RepID=UPI0025B5B71C|nr:hypothetical protein [Halomonas ramblicola]MDN3521246.1 hypothetical protein [Halomonas ramblicola]
MSRLAALLLLATLLAGCATPGAPVPPRELTFAVPPETALTTTAEVLMDSGYVLRHADADLGRLEAVLSRWPGYRVQAKVQAEGEGSRLALTATRGGRPLPPETLDRLSMDIQNRMAMD